jgi:hypothetical protein
MAAGNEKAGYENKKSFRAREKQRRLMETDVTINIPLEDTKLWYGWTPLQ